MATMEEAIALPVNHSTPKQPQKTFGCEQEDCPERKSLQTLQQSALDETELVGIGLTHTRHGKSSEKTKFRPSHGQIKLYHDSSHTDSGSDRHRVAETENKETQTDDSLLEDLIQQRLTDLGKRDCSLVGEEENEAYELMVKEPVPESYWKEVAEQRRLALNDTLEENRSLHQSVDSLKEENEKLLELASQAEHLSALLQSVVSEDEDEEKEAKNEQAGDNEDHHTASTVSDSLQGDHDKGVVPESEWSERDDDSKPSAVSADAEHRE
ncbi:uncharacterized protein LOC143280529 isoform X2 [Babylonia areolata]|uniref:uncharacterized protein LOC143280529 isoform X2 n=1 Tax=Babylonia areolata TaxID=304850 RepID=UPI003FD549F7